MAIFQYPEVDTPVPRGKNVVVLGVGNVAMDSARTAMRHGAESVRIIYRRSGDEMRARADEIRHAEEKGIVFSLLTNPIRYMGDEQGRLTGMACLEMELGEPDDSGAGRFFRFPVNFSSSDIRRRFWRY